MPPIDDTLGPQVPGENAFQSRMRRHQSWWRSERLGVPWGTGPTEGSDREVGSMLRTPDADAGLNFLTGEIHAVATDRMARGDGVEPFRCTHNLLSSQPMCFNLFGPFDRDHELALAMLRPLLPVAATSITEVRIEYAPTPREQYLGDRTAFDAFIGFLDGDHQPAFIGIETKLTEPFTDCRYDKPRYRSLTEAEGSPWSGSPPELADPRWNQLWRDQLLVEAVRRHPQNPHGRRGWLALVHHPGDPAIGGAVADYRRFLRDGSSLLEWPLDLLIDTFLGAATTPQHTAWLNDFGDRYLNLHLSE